MPWRASFLGLLAPLAIACAGEDRTAPGAGGSGGSGGADTTTVAVGPGPVAVSSSSSGSSVVTTTGGGGGEGGAGGDDRPLTLRAYVGAASYEYPEGHDLEVESHLYASVYAFPEDPYITCTLQAVGACVVTHCVRTEPEEGDEYVDVTGVFRDAGPITYEGPTLTRVLERDQNGYVDFFARELLFEGGEVLALTAPGGADLPGFDVELVAPHAIEVTEPSFAGATIVMGAVDVAWAGGGEGLVEARLKTTTAGDDAVEVTDWVSCLFEAAAGQGTIPAQLTAELATTSQGGVIASMVIETYSREVLEMSEGTLEVRASTLALSATSDSGLARGSLTVP